MGLYGKDKGYMTSTVSVPAVATAVFDELSKLEGDERKRALQAALAMLGDPMPAASGGGGSTGTGVQDAVLDMSDFPAKTKIWMKQHSVTADQLEHVFHNENGTFELIAASVPGNSKSKQMMAVYLLKGIAGLLSTGEPKINDKDARTAADNLGCYDQPNHSTNFKQNRANYLSGSKESDWTLTGPGLKAAADLIKSMQPT